MKYSVAISFFVFVAACGGSNHDAADMTPAPPDSLPLVGKLCVDTRADNWVLPIAKPSVNGSFQVTLLASAASPPVIGDLTDWTLQVADAKGAMVTGATITATPFMPDHGHGTSAVAHVTADVTAGQYDVMPLYLFMAGYWTITFTITDGSVTDTVVYSVCLADS
jgi:YtkA-like protein